MNYAHLWADEDGLKFTICTKEKILENLREYAEYETQPHVITSVEELRGRFWGRGDWEDVDAYIKFEILVPRAVEKVTEWEID